MIEAARKWPRPDLNSGLSATARAVSPKERLSEVARWERSRGSRRFSHPAAARLTQLEGWYRLEVGDRVGDEGPQTVPV